LKYFHSSIKYTHLHLLLGHYIPMRAAKWYLYATHQFNELSVFTFSNLILSH